MESDDKSIQGDNRPIGDVNGGGEKVINFSLDYSFNNVHMKMYV